MPCWSQRRVGSRWSARFLTAIVSGHGQPEPCHSRIRSHLDRTLECSNRRLPAVRLPPPESLREFEGAVQAAPGDVHAAKTLHQLRGQLN